MIEKYTPSDLEKVYEIEKLSFSNPWSENQFTEIEDKLYLAKEKGKILGFIAIDKILDEAHILHMAVRSESRRQGIGKKLIKFALKLPAKKWFLEVRAGNIGAQKLYESFGFKTISRRKKYYQDNDEDALIMELVV
ncbi:MAG: ribosomal-protein-alanine N-acetyltransferase [Candidatus Saganbacteria bacterium]|uniref:[Ribosomal protein bS18]-alanine N-acetyltransferase n=1 Tax=Candidatus Saganbacteria bacterium TaxID=2575572 RepID=A0A833NXY5_UNCSA|nr:MAG: ribosomal-protein-alanine N-acetyltransferase [Candidatus Saganbacteria bacterium]